MGNILIEKTEVYGIEASMRGMRNPLDSWHLQDTRIAVTDEEVADVVSGFIDNDIMCEAIIIGAKDMKLAHKLIYAGSEHCKFLRQIQVWADLTLPRYIWSELDTYKFNTKNSCSTMHKLFTENEITLDNFYYEHEYEGVILLDIIVNLDVLREEYLETKNYDFVRSGKRILPESFLQKRTVNFNYAELLNIYYQRKDHRLKNEWTAICDWIESLPYMHEFIKFKVTKQNGK